MINQTKIRNIIRGTINKVVSQGHILNEGIAYNKETNSFTFDFQHDNQTDVVPLISFGNIIEQFGKCYCYGYQFGDDIDSKVRAEFIKQIKFPESFDNEKDLNMFITRAVDFLDKQISLPKYSVVIYPQSLSELNRKVMAQISRITRTKYIAIKLIKELPSKIEFDYDRYTFEVLDSYVNGRPRYTQKQKEEVLNKIRIMMDNIHKSDYFSIARNVKKSKYRQYISNYYIFPDEAMKKLYETITNANVLLIDDIVTSGTTIYQLLYTLRSLNDTNDITIFSLLGKQLD